MKMVPFSDGNRRESRGSAVPAFRSGFHAQLISDADSPAQSKNFSNQHALARVSRSYTVRRSAPSMERLRARQEAIHFNGDHGDRVAW